MLPTVPAIQLMGGSAEAQGLHSEVRALDQALSEWMEILDKPQRAGEARGACTVALVRTVTALLNTRTEFDKD